MSQTVQVTLSNPFKQFVKAAKESGDVSPGKPLFDRIGTGKSQSKDPATLHPEGQYRQTLEETSAAQLSVLTGTTTAKSSQVSIAMQRNSMIPTLLNVVISQSPSIF